MAKLTLPEGVTNKLLVKTGKLVLDPSCCCGFVCGESCPTNLLLTLVGVTNPGGSGCTNCTDLNATWDIPDDGGIGSCGNDAGYDIGCHGCGGCDGFGNGMIVQWTITCNYEVSATPHRLVVIFTDSSSAGPFNKVTVEYKFADGDDLTDVPLTYVSGDAACLTNLTGALLPGITITATAVLP